MATKMNLSDDDSSCDRPSADDMDYERSKQVAYQYLCHLEETKLWLEEVLQSQIPPASELEENLRNGVILARLGHIISADTVPFKSIYDSDQKRYKTSGLNFRHTQNINLWLLALRRCGFPLIFLPEVPDVYDKKNMPKVIYSLHALSAHLFRIGKAPPMKDLWSKIEFSGDEVEKVSRELKESGVPMPAFHKIQGMLAKQFESDINSRTVVTAGEQSLPEVLTTEKQETTSMETGENPDEVETTSCEKIILEIEKGTPERLLHQLRKEWPAIANLIKPFAATLYFYELRDHLDMTGTLTPEVIENSIKTLNLVASVSEAVDSNNADAVCAAIKALNDYCQGVLLDSSTVLQPQVCLERFAAARRAKFHLENGLLTFDDIEDVLCAMEFDEDDENSSFMVKEKTSETEFFSAGKISPETEKLPEIFSPLDRGASGILSPNESLDFEKRNPEKENESPVNDEPNPTPCRKFSNSIFTQNEKIIEMKTEADIQLKKREMRASHEGSNASPGEIKQKVLIELNQVLAGYKRSADSVDDGPASKTAKSPTGEKWDRNCSSVEDFSSHSAVATEHLIQDLRSEVIEAIKKNQDLSKAVDEMDTKIGLLVRNKISLSAVIEGSGKTSKPSGIKSMSKQAKQLKNGYEKLFYLLQTRPEYLARLMVESPGNQIVQSCILNLFNLGSSPREAYLLLKLMQTALTTEVREKFRKPSDAVTGNPLVLKMAVGLARQTNGQHPLRGILAPLIYRVLEEKSALETNPVEIFRRWVNETETRSGCTSSLPRSVTQELALTHPEVVTRLNHNIEILKIWVKEFLTTLRESTHRFPYTLKIIAKCLQSALMEIFPETAEKDILKIIGHLIYYQYVNSAIVAPDAFHIIDLPASRPLRTEQRKNLASIAKILQFSASKSGFGEESKHLMVLNTFIIECHEIMKEISRECCNVPTPEEHYKMNAYSEAMLMYRPRIYMTVKELCDCDHLIRHHRSVVAPDSEDPIHQVLKDLGQPPTPSTLMGSDDPHIGKAMICLELDTEFFSQHKTGPKPEENNIRREQQTKELSELKITLTRLREKAEYFEKQLLYYEEYLATCLNNLSSKKKKSKSVKVIKYTGAQLLEKGVIVSLDSVPTNQLKNVVFEIFPAAFSGRYTVRCHFRGVQVDTAEIDIQELLNLQFEGCGVINMFGKARINVNLLLHLLNKKFNRTSGNS